MEPAILACAVLAGPGMRAQQAERVVDGGAVAPGPRVLQPEHRLVLAVLEDAIRSWHRFAGAPGRCAARRRHELLAWFTSEETGAPFAFANVCDHLGVDRGFLLTRLDLHASQVAA